MTSVAKPGMTRVTTPARRTARTQRQMAAEIEALRLRLEEAEETLRAIRSGEVDALIVSTEKGDQVFTLQGADRSYRALVEDMNEGALSLTSEGMILYANQKFASMLRAPLQEVIGSSVQQWVARDSQKSLRAILRDGGHRKCREELILASRDGSAVPAYLSVTPVVMEGAQECLGVVATDLSEQKRTEQALRLSETKFRNVFENSLLGKSMQSMNGEVKVNRAFCEILGYSEEELATKSWREITHPEDVEATQEVLNQLLTGTTSDVRFEKRYIHKSGSTVWTDVTIGIGRDAAGGPLYILTTVSDVTARKQADASLAELKQHLQRNIEMERLRLAQDLHDVPLQQLYAVIYKLEELRARAMPQNAPVIEQAIADIQKTLNSLRSTASELRPPALSRFGLEKAIRSYIEDFGEKHPDIHVKYALARDRQSLPEAVRLVLFRVMQEAFANIVRHAGATEISLRFEFDAEEARLEIRDNGKGFSVPESWLALAHSGHYGLAGMAERVSAAGGTLDIESAPGASTTIRVVIPSGQPLS